MDAEVGDADAGEDDTEEDGDFSDIGGDELCIM